MKELIEHLRDNYNIPEYIANSIILILLLISVLGIIINSLKKLRKYFLTRKLKYIINKDLHPYFTFNEVINYTKYYIPQNFQNITATEGEEPGKIHAAAARSKIMPLFINKGLLTISPIKYFIILSDTGMGKTAFLINLYLEYLKKKNIVPKYSIKLLPLGASNCLDKIKEIENKTDTILLLDAFDEDIKAVNNYKSRMIEILENVKDFRKVVFTCRTQFFPTKEEEPSDTNDITFGENNTHKIHKIYLSNFDDSDIIRYLLKKYKINIVKLFFAYKVVKKSPSLMFRPMLLSYIDDLVKNKIYYTYTYEIYKVLINNWIDRESKKPAILIRSKSDAYAKDLMTFSRLLAIDLYKNRTVRNGYFITISEMIEISPYTIQRTLQADPLSLTIEDKTGRSLLNRNSIGQYKFAHRSILEYFLALEIFESTLFLSTFNFQGMDATLNFHKELLASFLKSNSGRFILKGENKFRSLIQMSPSYINNTDLIHLDEVRYAGLDKIAGLSFIKKLILTDKSHTLLYYLYLLICIDRRNRKYGTANVNVHTFNSYKNDYANYFNILSELRPDINYEILNTLIENWEAEPTLKNQFSQLTNITNSQTPLTALEIVEIRELRNKIRENISENLLLNEGIEFNKKILKIKPLLNLTETFF
jgi:hypothetical protein